MKTATKSEYATTNKKTIRDFQLRPNHKPAKSALFIVTRHCIDIQQAEQLGTINKATTLHIVNYELYELQAAERKLKRLGFKNIVTHHSWIHDLELDFQIDFAFIDACGDFTESVYCWVKNVLWPQISEGGGVAFTFIGHNRRTKVPVVKDGIRTKRHLQRLGWRKNETENRVNMVRALDDACGRQGLHSLYKKHNGIGAMMLASRYDKHTAPQYIGVKGFSFTQTEAATMSVEALTKEIERLQRLIHS